MFSRLSFVLFTVCLFVLNFPCKSVLATVDPATGHYLGKAPTAAYISSVSAKTSSGIQAAECSHNTRMSKQLFAWFKIDASKAKNHGAPYGTCYATASSPPKSSQLVTNAGYDVFYWNKLGGQSGTGTGPIRDPQTGEIGWEDNNGVFHLGEGEGTDA